MTTEKQAAANRRNAQKSTGPRTATGKAKSRMNAVIWGLSSPSGLVVLPAECPGEFGLFRDALLADMDPVGVREELSALEAIEYSWRLRRIAKIELGILVRGVADADERYLTECKRLLEITEADVVGARLAASGIPDPGKVREIVDDELHEHLEGRIVEARATKETGEARLAAGFIEDATGTNALAKLSRYETMLFRHRDRALATLEALKAERSEGTRARA